MCSMQSFDTQGYTPLNAQHSLPVSQHYSTVYVYDTIYPCMLAPLSSASSDLNTHRDLNTHTDTQITYTQRRDYTQTHTYYTHTHTHTHTLGLDETV